KTVVDLGENVAENVTPGGLVTLSGITYQIFDDANCQNRKYEFTTDANGMIIRKLIPEGPYYIKQVDDASDNIIADTKTYKLIVGTTSHLMTVSDVEIQNSTIVDNVYRGAFSFTKVDEDDTQRKVALSRYGVYEYKLNTEQKLGRATFSITDIDDESAYEKIGEVISDQSGNVTAYNLMAGSYYRIKELEAPSGYQLSKNAIRFKMVKAAGNIAEVDANELSDGSGTLSGTVGSYTWNEPRLMVMIKKVDGSGNRLDGASLEIISVLGGTETILDRWVSGDNGEESHELSVDTGIFLKGGQQYIIRETAAPEGYVLASDKLFTADIKSIEPLTNPSNVRDQVQTVLVYNQLKPVNTVVIPTAKDPDEDEEDDDDKDPDDEPVNNEKPGDKRPKKPRKPDGVEVQSIPKKPHKDMEDSDKKPKDEPEITEEDDEDDTVRKSPKTGHSLIKEWFGM
nr:prealbumin-like fold domain-containing protein [Lachnospiraceae bacterium]